MTIQAAQQLLSLLKSELQAAKQLNAMLLEEREALTNSNTAVIDEVSRKKQPLLVQLEQSGRQRNQLLKNVGFPPGKSGLEAFIDNQDASVARQLTQLTGELKQLARSCHEHNQINGGIVNVNRQYLQRAMSILRGREPDSDAYGPGGEYTSQVVRQPLIGRV
ncbi:hypothetical protein MPL1_03483 [Methylophaga lonarensis MPL]|uniref:Flagellar biosynthesis protein FlgN n=1 Tax=Methylophaga lonarensis MPL TaxID=1286106 RepID=M7PTG3_9GAMM|nr:flagellar protein FlgN [Methylophaga lonarensis]EMR13744.1 hypothetical protein MPL1_03483 [Methylophaga lonarensis MPL]